MTTQDLIGYVDAYRREHPKSSKEDVARAAASRFRLSKHGALFTCDDLAVRFSWARGKSFPGTVCSLSTLQPFDDRPLVAVVVHPDSTEYLLANTTFLDKISHSSHHFQVDHVRGSFNGSNIVREYGGLINAPANFDQLFAMHQEFTWEENVTRLAEATGLIHGTGQRFAPTPAQRQAILDSPALAVALVGRSDYVAVQEELSRLVAAKRDAILRHAAIDNGKVRGDLIEREITGSISEHRLGDLVRHLGDGVMLHVEIKSKLLDRASSPKAYNVDKAIEALSDGRTAIAFCFVGVDLHSETVRSSTVSIFDETVLNATRVQFHWAGRNSRGVTQLTGDLTPLFVGGYRESVNVDKARGFLEELLGLD